MPKLAGVNLIAVLAAAIAMFFIGFVFYGLLFAEIFMAARGYTEAQLQADSSASWMIGGFVIELVIAFGIGWLLLKSGAASLVSAAGFGFAIAALIGFPLLAYNYIYSVQHSVPGLLVDWGHIAATFTVGAAVIHALSAKRAAAV